MAHLEEFPGLKRIELPCLQQVFIFLLTPLCGLSGLNVEKDCELQVSCKVILMQYNLCFDLFCLRILRLFSLSDCFSILITCLSSPPFR